MSEASTYFVPCGLCIKKEADFSSVDQCIFKSLNN
jgi:hypothetical protein